MNFSTLLLALCGLCLSFSAQAQTLSNTEIKPPFRTASCKSNDTDTVGELSISLDQLNISETATHLSLTAKDSLYVCTIATDGSKQLSAVKVNPFKGFEVQYFDDATSTIKNRKVFIDAAKPYNRMKLVTLNKPASSHGTISEVSMTENADGSFSGTLAILKTDVLSQKDLQKLAAGETVRKTIELDHVSNFTTYLAGEELQLGDEDRGGRNLILSFKKNGDKIVLTKISL